MIEASQGKAGVCCSLPDVFFRKRAIGHSNFADLFSFFAGVRAKDFKRSSIELFGQLVTNCPPVAYN